jgi:uncharacterized membrane protein YhaH (DUF805 family)
MWFAIKHGVRNSFNMSGRDSRHTFWYYVLFVYILTIAISSAATIPATFGAIFKGVKEGLANPEVSPQAQSEAMAAAMSDMIPITIWLGVATGLLLLFALAASFVRRLHDSGLSGWWALLPAALQVACLSLLPSQADRMRDVMAKTASGDPLANLSALESSLNFGTLMGWGALGLVILFGSRKSKDGPNRFGLEPYDVVKAEAQLRAERRNPRNDKF